MFVFTENVMLNGRTNICQIGIVNSRQERKCLGVDTVYQWIIVRGGIRVNRRDRRISPEVASVLLDDFLSFYMPNYY
jgi:hypothetical protein